MSYEAIKKLKKTQYLTRDEMKRLLSAPRRSTPLGARDFAILKLFLATGLRKAELLALDLDDLKFEGKNFYLLVKSKGGNVDEQPLEDDETILAISKYVSKINLGTDKKVPLFISFTTAGRATPNRLGRTALDYLVTKYSFLAGITKKISPHSLRHTFGTNFYRATKDPVATQKIMRHRSFASTAIYVHTDDDEVRAGLKLLSNI